MCGSAADEVVDLAARALRGDDLVHPGGLVEEGDRREIEARDLARGLHAGLDDVFLAERRAERLRRAIELALLDLGALELHEDALVLDGAETVARGLRGELLLVRREGRVLEPIDREDAAERLAVEHRDRRERADRAGPGVVGDLVRWA